MDRHAANKPSAAPRDFQFVALTAGSPSHACDELRIKRGWKNERTVFLCERHIWLESKGHLS